MDKKTEEMIALAVSYGVNCTFCMEYHKKLAVEAGVSEQQMRDAIAVAEMVKNGAAAKTKKVSVELFGSSGNNDGASCC